jgi:hypothetical protein
MRRLYTLDSAQRAAVTRDLAAATGEEPSIVFAYAFGSFVGDPPFTTSTSACT